MSYFCVKMLSIFFKRIISTYLNQLKLNLAMASVNIQFVFNKMIHVYPIKMTNSIFWGNKFECWATFIAHYWTLNCLHCLYLRTGLVPLVGSRHLVLLLWSDFFNFQLGIKDPKGYYGRTLLWKKKLAFFSKKTIGPDGKT